MAYFVFVPFIIAILVFYEDFELNMQAYKIKCFFILCMMIIAIVNWLGIQYINLLQYLILCFLSQNCENNLGNDIENNLTVVCNNGLLKISKIASFCLSIIIFLVSIACMIAMINA
jgi:hypothetical protein